MSTFVIVHGSFGGGWTWRETASYLRKGGHDVYTPTLTGLGERAHLLTPDVGLDTHVRDIVNVLEYEDLHDVILAGHSYGGIVITGASDLVSERLRHLVYIDAFAPEDGQSAADLVGPEAAHGFEEQARENGDGWRIPYQGSTPRQTAHPLRTLRDRVSLKDPRAIALPRTYIRCTQGASGQRGASNPGLLEMAVKARERGWGYYELDTIHSVWRTMPRELAVLLLEVADR